MSTFDPPHLDFHFADFPRLHTLVLGPACFNRRLGEHVDPWRSIERLMDHNLPGPALRSLLLDSSDLIQPETRQLFCRRIDPTSCYKLEETLLSLFNTHAVSTTFLLGKIGVNSIPPIVEALRGAFPRLHARGLMKTITSPGPPVLPSLRISL